METFSGKGLEIDVTEGKEEAAFTFSKEILKKFDELMGDQVNRDILSVDEHTPILSEDEIEFKFEELFKTGDFFIEKNNFEDDSQNIDANASSKHDQDSSEDSEKPNDADASDNVNESEAQDKQELTEEEINEKQREAIKAAFEKILRGEELTDKEKGNLCEMLMDQYYISQGYKPLHNRVTSLEDKGHQGIDGVYEKERADGSKHYIIADAKYGQSHQGSTADGTRQMSDDWIDKRLDDAVGKEKADEIRNAYEDDPSAISREIYHYEPKSNENGSTSSDVTSINPDGYKNGSKDLVQTFDEFGNVININDTLVKGD